jgi:hypothetical protein
MTASRRWMKFFITRWNLEPKDEDKEKYLRGELVEPKKPIVYYIDPATPKQWRENYCRSMTGRLLLNRQV